MPNFQNPRDFWLKHLLMEKGPLSSPEDRKLVLKATLTSRKKSSLWQSKQALPCDWSKRMWSLGLQRGGLFAFGCGCEEFLQVVPCWRGKIGV